MNRPVAAVVASIPLLFGGMTACAPPAPPPVNCQNYNVNTNVHDSSSGLGMVHIQWGVTACWYMDGTLAQWSPYFNHSAYGSMAPFTATDVGAMVVTGWQAERIEFHVSLTYGIGPAQYKSVGTQFFCALGIPTPYYQIGDPYVGCDVIQGNEEYLSHSN